MQTHYYLILGSRYTRLPCWNVFAYLLVQPSTVDDNMQLFLFCFLLVCFCLFVLATLSTESSVIVCVAWKHDTKIPKLIESSIA